MAWEPHDVAPLSLGLEFDPPADPWTQQYWGPLGLALDAGVAPVTGTASWEQAAAAWEATLSERIAATATFAQTANWDATATERFTSTASFVQAAATWDAAALERYTAVATWTQDASWDASALVANPVSATATWEQSASWEATGAERFTAAATFEQTGTWEAAASESIPSTATWSQDAQWGALGMVAEDVLADATFEQAAASWLAATSELIVGSGTWEQVNTWLATVVEAFTSTATWEQGAVWEAAGDVDNPAVDATGEWTQAAATWAGIATTPVIGPAVGGGFASRRQRPLRRLPETIFIGATASFVQEPATWHAEMQVTRSRQERDIEELVLVGAL